ncbi:hypothetical protein [Telmatospirillum siberiense]|uniref:Glycosyltransferase RgtA/B/C/D-like domain-containing protein n=1 Tax=Telmatospirillum siberiense TaxID=382514 RepID=A0A2N3PV97_9PROT|nr:hypothetical protein [Telmatospirillum siberiense]PKU24310.1 hypothetical protein CWS72_11990 [Telmatospirillum siberiense]
MSGGVEKPSYSRFFVFLLAGAVVFRIGAAFWTVGHTDLTVWGDRDLWRALTAASAWPVTGPEINGGLRPPGGAFYLLLGGILAIAPNALAAHVGLLALFAASVLLVGFAVAREISPRAGIIAAAALAGAPMLDLVLKIWNPGYLLFFATAATIFGLRYLRNGSALALGLASAAIALGLQIHLQIFQLAIALTVAALLRRPGWGKRHTLALLLGWAVPYLPALLAGGRHLLASAAPMPGEAVDNYMLWEFHPLEKAQLVYGMLGGTPQITDAVVSGRFLGPAILPMLGDLLAMLLVMAFAVRTFRRRPAGTPPADRIEPRTLFGPLTLILAVYLAVALGSTVNARHMVAVWPAVAIMTGIAADAGLRRLETRLPPKPAFAAGAVLFIALAARPVSLGEATLRDAPFGLNSLAAQTEIAATAKTSFYAGHEAFDAHAALFWRPAGRSWQMVQEGISGQMDFVYRTTRAQTLANDRTECLAIVPKQYLADGVPVDLLKAPAFSGLAPALSPMAAESAHFAYFPYTTADGNCLKSFPNAYIPTRFEETYLAPGTAPAATSTAEAAQFAASLPGQRFPIGLELRREEGRYLTVLHGRLLRGYTGLHFATIVNPVLCLVGDGGAVRVVPVARLTVGSPQHGSLAPWRSAPFTLPDGDYRLWLTGRDGKSPQFLQIPLGHISLPGMAAAVPGPDMAAPPAGCPAPPAAERTGG